MSENSESPLDPSGIICPEELARKKTRIREKAADSHEAVDCDMSETRETRERFRRKYSVAEKLEIPLTDAEQLLSEKGWDSEVVIADFFKAKMVTQKNPFLQNPFLAGTALQTSLKRPNPFLKERPGINPFISTQAISAKEPASLPTPSPDCDQSGAPVSTCACGRPLPPDAKFCSECGRPNKIVVDAGVTPAQGAHHIPKQPEASKPTTKAKWSRTTVGQREDIISQVEAKMNEKDDEGNLVSKDNAILEIARVSGYSAFLIRTWIKDQEIYKKQADKSRTYVTVVRKHQHKGTISCHKFE